MESKSASAIGSVEQLEQYLKVAIRLEHSTIPPYLVALYSIVPGSNLNASNVLRAIVIEEMLHLTNAANLLNAVGGTPDLTYPGFVPKYPTRLPDGETDFEVSRAGLTRASVESFLKIERPAKDNRGARRPDAALRTQLRGSGLAIDYDSIGEFYDAVLAGFRTMYAQLGPVLFRGDPVRQITSKYYYSSGGSVIPVHDLDSAMAAIAVIIQQGEGAHCSIEDADGEIAHYYRFEQLLLGRAYNVGDRPGVPSGAPLTVDWDAVYPVKANVTEDDYPAGSEIAAASQDFNCGYAEFLATLTKAFNGKPELLIPAIGGMFRLRNLITALVKNAIPGQEEYHGAPTFEVNLANVAAPITTGLEPADLDAFLALSVGLTGFTEYDLQGTGMAKAYFSAAAEIVGLDVLRQIAGVYQRAVADAGGDADSLMRGLRAHLFAESKLGPVTRNLVKLWYSGYWYQLPDEWRKRHGTSERDVTFAVSAESYTEGLLWKAVGSNPPGAKAPGYGTWGDPPDPA